MQDKSRDIPDNLRLFKPQIMAAKAGNDKYWTPEGIQDEIRRMGYKRPPSIHTINAVVKHYSRVSYLILEALKRLIERNKFHEQEYFKQKAELDKAFNEKLGAVLDRILNNNETVA